ncbi:MAG: GNAT family N-acetyltransferase [Coriobacteriia bacterium]|nr:GNAT family N-acetyltransferase [Coriobacteriia bacterium]
MSVLELVWIGADDPRMTLVHALRHEALFAPFGIARDDGWDDAGDDRRHLISLRDGELVGYACLLLTAEGNGHVRQVSVRPDLQRTGIGRALMLEVEAEAVRLRLPLLWLDARHTAESFYHRLGYSTRSGMFPSGRTGIPHVRMEKRPGR